MNQTTYRIIQWLITLLLPFFLGFAFITFVISPAYPTWAYAQESFPPDRFGFSQEQRLELALVAVDYLQRPEPAAETIYLLEEQIEPNQGTPLYNEEEIGHMIDVKIVTDAIRTSAWVLGVLLVAGFGFLLYGPKSRLFAYRGLRNGGILGTIILLGIALFIGSGWDTFFVLFHELLFADGTWTFPLSDSLIRLFPEKFWFDIGVIMSGGTLLLQMISGAVGWVLVRRSA